jgi:predicted HicB family RNase H-like nuclease
MENLKKLAEHYSYSVEWSAMDEVYVSRVREFPLLAAHGSNRQDALREIQFVVEAVLEDMRENNEEIPRPFGEQNFSGKLNVRLPEYLHRKLKREAAEEGISLNMLINLKLERSLED